MFQVVRRFSVGELITLYIIDLTRQGGSIHYFTNNIFEERVPIKFNGQDYIHMPVMMESIDVDSQGQPAQPRFSIATAGGPTNALIQQYKDLKGAWVWRFKTFAEFLQNKPDGAGGVIPNPGHDPAAVIGEELYIIDRKVAADDTYAEFQLVAPTDFEGIQIPLRIVRKRWCDALYRYYDPSTGNFHYYPPAEGGCPWGQVTPDGGKYFNANNQPCAKAQDRCSQQLTGCKARFGTTETLPVGMFPGVKATSEN
jgi:lambda family phage minor tail protein L